LSFQKITQGQANCKAPETNSTRKAGIKYDRSTATCVELNHHDHSMRIAICSLNPTEKSQGNFILPSHRRVVGDAQVANYERFGIDLAGVDGYRNVSHRARQIQ